MSVYLASACLSDRLSPCLCSVESITCRICHEGGSSERLVSPCHCAGTMGLQHRSCVERWLGSSNSNNCEICKFEYKTERRPRPLVEVSAEMDTEMGRIKIRTLSPCGHRRVSRWPWAYTFVTVVVAALSVAVALRCSGCALRCSGSPL